MTLKEAKKILKKEGFHMALANKVIYQNGAIREFEKPEVCEAIKVANANRWTVGLSPIEWDDREARLKKEHEKHANASDKMGMTLKEAMKILNKEIFGIRIKKFDKPLKFEEKLWIRNEKPEVLEALHIVAKNGISVSVPKTALRIRSLIIEKMKAGEGAPAPVSGTPLSAVEGMKLQRKDNNNTEKNPALAESASQFNDALLDEQAKKIKRLGKEIARLNKIIHKKNLKIDEMRKESSRHLEGKMKMFGENFDLEQELKDKNAVLSDVAEELRLSKIREKNLTEVCQKYMKENENLKEHLKESKESAMKYASLLSDAYDELRELKKKLANKIVDKIDAQALNSAESALAWKEKKIAEKDEVIAELREKLKSINMNRHNERICKKQLAEKDEVIADLGKELAEANKHQQQAYRSCADKNKEIRALKLQISALEKRGNGIDWKRNADAIKLYVNRASHERLWSPISQDICNEQELSFIINHGCKRVKYALRFDGTDIVYECSDPDKKPSFFRDDSVGAVTNQKDCSPVKDTHPTEDNPEEIEIEKADKVVDKIDAQAFKSAESALAWKEKLIYYKDMAIAYNEKMIADLQEKLAATKKELTESKKRIEWVRNASKEYCDYGVAANEFIKELAGLYVLANNNDIINDEMLERCKNYQTYGFPANCNREAKKEIDNIARGKENKKPRIPTPEEPKHDNSFKDFIRKTIDNYNRRAAELGCAGSKDGNGIFDQMVGTDIAEEGGDNSGVTVLCGKDCIDDIIKKMK